MTAEDSKNLNLLSTFHFVFGGIGILFSLFPIMHVIMGLAIVSGKFFGKTHQSEAPPEFFGWMFVITGTLFIVFGLTLSTMMLITGKKLRERRSLLFCKIVSGVECMFMPFGTVLGIFSLIMLSKEDIQKEFR